MPTLAGVWKLVETHAFDESGQEVPSPIGPSPIRVMIFDAQQIVAAVAGDGRVADLANRAFAAYCGKYTFDGTNVVARVDNASSPALLEDQVRTVRFEGPNRMRVVPVSTLFGRSAGLELVWERVG